MKINYYFIFLYLLLLNHSFAQDEWTLIFRQTAPFYQSPSNWINYNENDPNNANFSILNNLEDFRGDDGKFHFKLEWPGGSVYNSNGGNIDFLPQEWKQTSNPLTSENVIDYEPINVNYTGMFWAGLENADNNSTGNLIDGSVDHGYWFYALGTQNPWNNCIPGPADNNNFYGAQVVELYVKNNILTGCDFSNDGTVDIIDIIAMIDCILTSGCFEDPQCDWNEDGSLNILDVISTMECILSAGCPQDCNGVWGGESTYDECGQCNGDGSSCGVIFESIPKHNHFYARNLENNQCSFNISGQTVGIEENGNLSVIITKDGLPFYNTITSYSQFDVEITIESGKHLYQLEVLWDNAANEWETVTTVNDIICGDAYIINGQSNAVALDYHNEQLADQYSSTFIRSFGSSINNNTTSNFMDFNIAVAESGYTQGAIGQWGLQLANELLENEDVPILIINGAVGGTNISQHQRNDINPVDMNTIYGRLLWRAKEANLEGNIRGIIWHQGESDGNMPYDTYLNLWTSLYNDWLEDYQNLEGIYTFQVRSGCGSPTWNRNVHRELPEILPLVLGSMSTTGIDGHDNCHFYNQTYVEWGNRISRLIRKDLYSSDVPNNHRAPNPVNASWIEPNKLEINFGTTGENLILQTGSLQYFSLSDGSIIIDASVSGNSIHLTTDLPSNANWVSFVDIPGDIPWLINNLGIGSFAFYEFPITQ